MHFTYPTECTEGGPGCDNIDPLVAGKRYCKFVACGGSLAHNEIGASPETKHVLVMGVVDEEMKAHEEPITILILTYFEIYYTIHAVECI